MTAAFAPAPQTTFRPQPVPRSAPSDHTFEQDQSELATVHYLPVRQTPGVYRIRRVVLAVVLVCVLLGGGALVSSTTAATTVNRETSSDVTVVIQPGDTLWGIARSLKPGDDPRELVSQLTGLAGSNELSPGQELAIPNSWLS